MGRLQSRENKKREFLNKKTILENLKNEGKKGQEDWETLKRGKRSKERLKTVKGWVCS